MHLQWSLTALQGTPPARGNASICLDPATNTLYMFGGLDTHGSPTNTLFKLDLHAMPQRNWEAVDCEAPPSPRWGHTSFISSGKMFVYGGASSKQKSDMFCMDLHTRVWSKATQSGRKPDRAFNSKEQTFRKATLLSGGIMATFGKEPQENADASKPAEALNLQLHAYDTAFGDWASIHSSSHIPFDHLEGLVAWDSKLLCIGWSWLPAGVKGDSLMQVCSLDLSHVFSRATTAPTSPIARRTPTAFSPPAARSLRSRTTPCWTPLHVKAAPTARVGCAVAVLRDQLVLHGGMPCSPGAKAQLTADVFCLDLPTMTWTQIGGSEPNIVPRVNHAMVSVESANAIVVLGGTSNRQQHASCSTMNCIRLKQVMTPVPKPAVVDKATAAPTTGCKAVHALAEASGSSQPSRKRVASLDPARSAATAPAVVPGDQAARPAAAAVKAAASAPAAISAKKATAAAQPAEVTHQGMIGKPPAVEALTPPLSSTWAKVPVCHATPAIFPGPAAATGGQGPVPAPAMAVNDLIPGYDFSAYCCQEPLSDVDLVAGGETFPAHRLVLCVSDKFRELLSTADSGQQRLPGGLECRWKLELQDVYPDVLKMLLQYMYGCLKDIPLEAAPLLFKASDRYGLPGLRAACLAVLVSSISLETVTSYTLLAHDHSCKELTQACVLFTAATSERFLQVLSTPGYLHLNQINPGAGQAFMQAAMEHMTGRK